MAVRNQPARFTIFSLGVAIALSLTAACSATESAPSGGSEPRTENSPESTTTPSASVVSSEDAGPYSSSVELSPADIEIEAGLSPEEFAKKYVEMYMRSYTYLSNDAFLDKWLDVPGGAEDRNAFVKTEAQNTADLFGNALLVENWKDSPTLSDYFGEDYIASIANDANIWITTSNDSVQYKRGGEVGNVQLIEDQGSGRVIDVTYIARDNIAEISSLSSLESLEGHDAIIELTTTVVNGVEKISDIKVLDYIR